MAMMLDAQKEMIDGDIAMRYPSYEPPTVDPIQPAATTQPVGSYPTYQPPTIDPTPIDTSEGSYSQTGIQPPNEAMMIPDDTIEPWEPPPPGPITPPPDDPIPDPFVPPDTVLPGDPPPPSSGEDDPTGGQTVSSPSLDELYPTAPTAVAPGVPDITDPTGATVTNVDPSGTAVGTEDAGTGQIGDVTGAGTTETDQTVGQVATPGTAGADTDRIGGILDQGAAGMDAAQAELTPEQQVDAELARILGQDSPLLARAREEAMRTMNARGLTNTSMAAGATYGAMVDRAMPMAQQNAAQNFQRAQQNAAFLQQAGIFNAEQANALMGLEAQLGTQVNIFNAEQLNRASELTAQLMTAMEQQDADAYNRAALQLAELQYGAMVEQAQLDQQTNLFNAEQQNRANSLMAELETAIAQQDADAANRASMQLADLRRQAQAQQGELEFAAEQQRAAEQQAYNSQVIDAVTRLNQQYLQGTQAMDLATLQSQYQLLIQTNETAGNVFNNYMSAMGNIMANPDMSTSQIASATQSLQRMLEASLNMMAEINGMDFGDVEGIIPGGAYSGAGGDGTTTPVNPYYPYYPYPGYQLP